MSSITPMSERLRSLISEWSDSDHEWELYVKDHRELIIENSSTIQITADNMRKYQFRLETFLYDKNLDIDYRMTWIVLWLNQLNSNLDFVDLSSLIVPNRSYILRLYEKYRAFKSYLAE